MLRDQLYVKDEQIRSLNDKIDNLIERDRETNILLKGLQDKFLYLEKPKPESSRANGEKKETNEAPRTEAKAAKETKEEPKIKNNKNAAKEIKGRQDTPEKLTKQKKPGDDKPKKGFWGGLFLRKRGEPPLFLFDEMIVCCYGNGGSKVVAYLKNGGFNNGRFGRNRGAKWIQRRVRAASAGLSECD
jgi:hypothetical protein